jgi:RNA polymerase sigma-70 factor (ECF subfamily)
MDEMTRASDPTRRFVRLLLANQNALYAYILTLVPNWSDADDLMQEVAEVMWRRFDQAEPITNFSAWGRGIARNKVLNYYARKRRERVLFDSDLFEEIAGRAERTSHQVNARLQALQRCLPKLRETDRLLIQRMYEQGVTIKDLAAQVHRPVQGLYKAVARIHQALIRCVNRVLASEGSP